MSNTRPPARGSRTTSRQVRMTPPARSRMALVGHPRRRARTGLLIFTLILALFAWQLVRLQWIDAGDVAAKALRTRMTTTVVPAPRGTITSQDGQVLARSVQRIDITGDPEAASSYEIKNPKAGKPGQPRRLKVGIPGVSKAVADVLGGDAQEIEKKFNAAAKKKSRFLYVAKDVSPAQWSQIRALGLPGIYSNEYQKREYPQGTDFSPLIGWINQAGQAGGGIEQMLDTDLAGKNGVHQIERARDGQVIATGDNLDVKPISGRNVQLTIDSDLQWFATNELAAQVKATKALSGEVVIANTSGDILAATSYPSFDNNNMATAKSSDLQSRAFNDTWEPGSTQKILTIGGLLEKGIVTPETHVEVPPTLKRAGRTFHDAEVHGTEYLTVAGVVAQSSNIGTVLVGEKMAKQDLHGFMMKAGLGQKTGIGFPGESAGYVPKVSQWNGDTWYTVMFGQGLSSSPMQQIGLFQAVANGGMRSPLKLIKAVQDVDGAMKKPNDTRTSTRLFSQKTSQELIEMMKGVVSKEGSAEKAAVPGYDVAGKTSTAERYDVTKGRYDGVTAGFIGMAPANNPKLIVLVSLQKPKTGTFGGQIAAPTFSKIMGYALQHEKIPPSKSEKLTYPLKYRHEESTGK